MGADAAEHVHATDTIGIPAFVTRTIEPVQAERRPVRRHLRRGKGTADAPPDQDRPLARNVLAGRGRWRRQRAVSTVFAPRVIQDRAARQQVTGGGDLAVPQQSGDQRRIGDPGAVPLGDRGAR